MIVCFYECQGPQAEAILVRLAEALTSSDSAPDTQFLKSADQENLYLLILYGSHPPHVAVPASVRTWTFVDRRID
ncbi:MAG: hypothetical protein JSV66_09225 [Trueperaceae bacterium]|nr:MAG: hypothetical protein JSV66_09225 [Trueperaceae bacterium]